LYAVFLAELGHVLAGRLDQDEVSFHSTYHHRDRPGTEQLVALLGNSLLMRLDLSGSPSRDERISRAMTTTFEAFDHARAPVMALPAAQPDLPFREPLAPLEAFRVNYNFLLDRGPAPPRNFGDLEFHPIPSRHRTSRFDLMVVVRGSADEFVLTLWYATHLFRRDTAEQLLRDYVNTIESA
jgi:hypothetical protein